MPYPLLFSPEKIGSLELSNRLVMTAMGCGLANEDGTLTDRFISYYEERAKGGVGLIVTEVACVNPVHGVRAERQMYVTDDAQLPMLKKLADAIHRYDTKIFVQLLHPGVNTTCAVNGGGPLVSPSGIASKFMRQQAREITHEEIRELIKQYADGAMRVKKAGLDGVEIQIGHHYLLHEFLSPYFNKRTDEYGGSFENRTRLIREIIQAVRKTVGEDFPVVVRLSAEDYMGDESYHLEESIKVAQMLEKLDVNALSVTAGGIENGKSHSLEPTSYKQGWRKHLAIAIKRMVNIPIISTTVIRDPIYAETLLEEGAVDFIGMGRSFLADPFWAQKVRNGKPEQIRKCISCLRCIDNIKSEKPIICSINPTCGNEIDVPQIARDGAGRLAVVVGGGVAGMEAARILAYRKYKVVLFEKTAHLGGQVYLASNVPGKDKMGWLVDYLSADLVAHGVEIRLNTEAGIVELQDMKPHVIIDSTGASAWKPDDIPGIDAPCVLTPVEILSGSAIPKNKSVVIAGSGLTGLETAELLIEHGNYMTIIEMADQIAPGASKVNVNDILQRLAVHDVVIICNRKLTKIEQDRIHYEDTRSGEEYVFPMDYLVLSLGARSNGNIHKELADSGMNILCIGDAAIPSRIHEAISSGYNAAISV